MSFGRLGAMGAGFGGMGSVSIGQRLPSGLVAAWRTDTGVTAPGSVVSSVASAYGVASNALAPTTGAPTVPTITAPGSKNLIKFTKASSQFMNAASAVSGSAGTGFTVATVISCQDVSANTIFLGQTSTSTNSIGVQTNAGAVRVKVGSATITNITASPSLANKGLHLLLVTYDGAGTVNVYIDGQLAGTNATFGSQAWSFQQVGSGNGVSFFDGYLGPILIWNRTLGASEIANVFAFLDPWRGYTYYLDSAVGSDSSTTPWHSSTPWQNLSKANTFGWIGEETLAPKGGQIHRQSANNFVTTAGLSITKRMSLDGALWGTGRAEIRSSIAPTGIANVPATLIYTFTAAAKPNTFVFYLTFGAVSFGANRTLNSSLQRLVENTTTPTTPGFGEWGYSGTDCYVNAGRSIADGDIEYVPIGSTSGWDVARSNWAVKNLYYRFAISGLAPGTANVRYSFVDVDFSLEDGIDASPSTQATNLEIEDCIVAWPGKGFTNTGSSAGDGFSFHLDATVTVRRCIAYWAGKQGMSWHDSATVDVDRFLSIGQTACRALQGGTGGSGTATLRNVVGWIMTNANSLTEGITNESSLATINAYNCTFYSQSSQGTGIRRNNGTIAASNIIIKGFSTDISASNVTVDHACTHGVSTANVAAGNGNLVNTDPLLTDAANYDLSLQAGSTCKHAGVAVSGLLTDYAGTTRGTVPSIGAYE